MTTEQQIDKGFTPHIIVTGLPDDNDLQLREVMGAHAFTMYGSDFIVHRCDTEHAEGAMYQVIDKISGSSVGNIGLTADEAMENAIDVLDKYGEFGYLKATVKRIRQMLKHGIELHKIGKVK